MKIDVEKWIIHDKGNKMYDIISYRIINTKYCCNEIKQLPVNLHYEMPESECDYNYEDDEDCRTLGIMIEDKYMNYDGEDYYPETRYHLIKYCPRCGKKFEVNVVREIDKTDEYYSLKAKYEPIHNQWMKCDSKKKSAELEIEWRAIDKKINDFYQTELLK